MAKPILILFYPSTVPENHPRFSMPYALLYLERAVRELGIEIILIDEDINPDYENELKKNKTIPSFVGVSTMTGKQIAGGIKFSKYIRTNFLEAKIIWGGWHPSVLPEQTIKEDYIDFVVHGQGEKAFKELILSILEQKDYTQIKGLAYKREKQIIVNERDGYQDYNNFPAVNFELLDLQKYVVADTIVYFASHGCVYECGFCAMSTMYKKKWFSKPVQKIIEELAYLQRATQFKYINFQDDNFFVNRPFTLSLCHAIIESGLHFEFITSAHARNLLTYSDEELEIIYKAGCRKVYIGAESGSQEVLDLINKKETVADNFAVLERLKMHNIITVFSTMVCLPLNPDRDVKLTLGMLTKAKLMDKNLEALIFYYTPFPQTPLYEWAIKKGFTPPTKLENWSTYTMFNADLPWHKKQYKRKLEYFYNYYFPFYNKSVEDLAPQELKAKVRLFLKLFYKLNHWRFRNNFFYFPFEAILMLYFARKFNTTFKQRFCFSGTWSFNENRYF